MDYAGIYKNALIIKSQLMFEKWKDFDLQEIYKFAQRNLIRPVRKSSNWSERLLREGGKPSHVEVK